MVAYCSGGFGPRQQVTTAAKLTYRGRPHLNLSANREDFGMMRKPKFLSNAKKDTETWPLQIREK